MWTEALPKTSVQAGDGVNDCQVFRVWVACLMSYLNTLLLMLEFRQVSSLPCSGIAEQDWRIGAL